MVQSVHCSIDEFATVLECAVLCQAIDVREPAEFQSEHITGTRSAPLSELESQLSGLDPKQPVFVICHSGQRARTAAERLATRGFADVRVVEGGLVAWSRAGRPVEQGVRRVWALDRQVRFVAGALVLVGVALSLWVAPAWIGLSAFVGAGLVFSGVTDICAMGMLLARAPWNRARSQRHGTRDQECSTRSHSSIASSRADAVRPVG